jgi:hypothetical protein
MEENGNKLYRAMKNRREKVERDEQKKKVKTQVKNCVA